MLREALALAGREERVLMFPDNLSFGPIEPLDSKARLAWALREFDESPWGEEISEYDPSWDAALSSDMRPVVWMSKRSTQEYAGFLGYLWRLGDLECEIVDVTDLVLPVQHPRDGGAKSYRPMSIAIMRPDQIMDIGLLDRSRTLHTADRIAYRATWDRLRAENAPFRIIDADGHLVSAPIDIFDSQLLAHVTNRWLKAARIIGGTMSAWDEIMQTGDLILAARLRALAEAGVIESQGNLFNIRHSEVRWPAREI
jgi:hypothetical protein